MSRSTARVLVVDDEARQRHSLVDLLQSGGYSAEAVADGASALNALDRDAAAVVVLDWFLGEISAGSLLSQLRMRYPQCPVIVVSGYPAHELRDSALAQGAWRFWHRPFDGARFLHSVGEALCQLDVSGFDLGQLERQQPGLLLDWCLGEGPDGLCVLDRDGRMHHANEAMRACLGIGADKVVGVSLAELLVRADWQILEARLRQLPAASEQWQAGVQSLRTQAQVDCASAPRFELRLRATPWPGVGAEDADPLAVLVSARELPEAGAGAMQRGLHDILTGLPNRALLNDRLRHAIRRAQRRQSALAVMFIDLDRFKWVNDNLGHRIGDHLLQAAADRLQQVLRAGDTLARYGGDEFVLLVDPAPDAADLDAVAGKIVATLNRPFNFERHELHVSGSIGLARFPDDAQTADALIECADLAMYAAKQGGKNSFSHYRAELRERHERRLRADRHLKHALSRDEFVLHYQPQFRVKGESLKGFEALLRWNHPDRGLLQAADFIDQAEGSGLIGPMGEWVMRRVFQDLRAWTKKHRRPVQVTVNLSPTQLGDPGLLPCLDRLMAEYGIDGDQLVVDVPETALIADPVLASQTLKALAARKIHIVIDDFGTGHLPLTLLHSLPISALKLDGSFVRDLGAQTEQAALISAVAAMARGLGLGLSAEGVESRLQLQRLDEYGAEIAQGFYFSAAIPFEQASEMLRGKRH